MKLKTILTVSAVALLFVVSCSKKETMPTAADVSGTYKGYTLGSSTYFKNTCTADETVSIAENPDGTAIVTFISDSWGEFIINSTQIVENDGSYTLTGEGQTKMGMGGKVSAYNCSYTAVFESRDKARMQFKVPDVMGGLTIEFATGEAPADLLLAGTWKGYSSGSCKFFKDVYTDDESLKITANGDGTLAVIFESKEWGKFSVAKTAATKSGKDYTFAGAGKVFMGMGDNKKDYDFTMKGKTNSAKDDFSIEFNVPSVMGGLTITLLPGKSPQANDKQSK